MPKKDEDIRIRIYYRIQKNITKKNTYHIEFVNYIHNRLYCQNYFSIIDLKSEYLQIPITHGTDGITAFSYEA